MNEIEDLAGEGEALGAHHGGDRWDPSLQGELDLRLVLVLGSEGHREDIPLEEVAAEAGHPATDIEHHAGALPPRNVPHGLQRKPSSPKASMSSKNKAGRKKWKTIAPYSLDEIDVVQRPMDELRPAAGEGEVLPGDLHPVLVPLHHGQLGMRNILVPDLRTRNNH